MLVHDKNRKNGKKHIEENMWLRLSQDSTEFAPIFGKQLPVFDASGVPVGIVKSRIYVNDTNIAKVLVIVRGTCLLQNEPDTDLNELKKHGWYVRTIDAHYKLRPENGPFEKKYIGLVSIRSVPTLTAV